MDARSASVRSAARSSVGEIEELAGEGERLYVAVGKELKQSKSTLLWALRNISKEEKIVLVHVHQPALFVPMLGGKFPVSQLKQEQVQAYRQLEWEKVDKVLDEYLLMCKHVKVQAEKLVIEKDDIGKGLVELILKHGITKLVMGASADKHYSKKMTAPRSKTAIHVREQADLLCKIWFVCKGNLIYTREASLHGSEVANSPTTSSLISSFRSNLSEVPTSPDEPLSSHSSSMREPFRQRSRPDNFDSHGGRIMRPIISYKEPSRRSIPGSRLNAEGSINDSWEEISRSCSQSSDPPSWSASDEVLSNSGSLSVPKDEESEDLMLHSVHESDGDIQFSSARNELLQEDLSVDADEYDILQQALTEAENAKREAYEESCRRRKAERDKIEAQRRAKVSELLYTETATQRREVEEILKRTNLELEGLRNQQNEILEELEKANEQKSALEIRITDSEHIIKDLEEKLLGSDHIIKDLEEKLLDSDHIIKDLEEKLLDSDHVIKHLKGKLLEDQYCLSSLQMDHEKLQQEHDDAVREAAELRQKNEQNIASSSGAMNVSSFSYSELQQATHSFDISLKIGESGYGSVYKGVLRHTPVAIKLLNTQSMQGLSEFHWEVELLGRVRHPNLVNLLGACPEACALIYEFLPNGSLEDCLECKNNTQPLAWQTRTRIVAEICSALIFLHSNKPHPIVHGNLKPENILLDANYVSKVGDFGICCLFNQFDTATTTLYRYTHPKGTFAYMDPELVATGELTPCSDVYSFGVVILRLLTGRPAVGIVKEVQAAVEKGFFYDLIDPLAGEWPFVQAKQLADLGLRCCEMSHRNRPDLRVDAWRVIESTTKAASFSAPQLSFRSVSEDNNRVPSHFICPIFQDIMRDPHIAADGFTYEGEAVRGWFDSGHNSSPMTNLRLPNKDLIPNRALRSAIQEWLEQQS